MQVNRSSNQQSSVSLVVDDGMAIVRPDDKVKDGVFRGGRMVDGRGGGGGTTCTGFHLPVSKSPTPRTCNSSFPALESANIKLKANKANIKGK